MNKTIAAAVTFLALAVSTVAAAAQPILSVTLPDASGKAVTKTFTAQEIQEMPQTAVETGNDYVEGVRVFEGPLMRDFLPGLKATDTVSATALNDYSVTIPAADLLNYPVILAMTMDGEKMSVRDKGPLWVIYPMSQHPELKKPEFNDRLIWQVSKLELHRAK